MPPDLQHLHDIVETLERIERPPASDGEREAAEWIRDRFEALGARARVEAEDAHGSFWWPLAATTAAAALAGARGGRAAAALGGALAAAGVVDEVTAGPHLLRRVLRRRRTHNVVAEVGDASAPRTVVFIAHHDAAHGGLVFRPELITIPADRFPGWYAKQETSPPPMQLVVAGPALVALGALTGLRPVRALGTAISLVSAAAFLDIAAHRTVPGANDNLTSVAAVLELARIFAAEPPEGVRLVLVSTGAEESFMEGMRGFARRHFPALPRHSTRMICLECLGSPELIVMEGEGMLWMTDYPQASRDFLAACGDRAGVPLRRGLRCGLATDGLIARKAGYDVATLASITKYKFPSNYHSPEDRAANLEWDSVADAVRVCEEVVRSSVP